MTIPHNIAHTWTWTGDRTLPDWLDRHHHWHTDRPVIHTTDGPRHLYDGWMVILWTDQAITVASTTVAERVYGNDGLWGRLQRAEHEIAQHTEAEAADIAAGSYAGRAETAERGLSRLLDLVRDFLDDSVCDLDAYGYCVAHSWACSGLRCPHARARDVLAALDGEPQPEDLTGAYQPDPPIGCITATAAPDRLAQSGVDTPGCNCGHEGMGVSWHRDDCPWRRSAVDCPGRPTPG